jgi:uncharacterized membrane protein
MIFVWYGLGSGTAFRAGIRFMENSVSSLQNIFDMTSRNAGTAAALGVGITTKTFPQQLEFITSWLTIALIAVGMLSSLFNYRHSVEIYTDSETKAPHYLKRKFDLEYIILSFVCCIILFLAVALPFVFVGYGMDRAYCQMMILLSPFFIIGGITISKLFQRNIAYAIILIVLIPYFMCTTGIIYQMFDIPKSLALNARGYDYDTMYIHEQEIQSARWLGMHETNNLVSYSDWFGTDRLISQGVTNAYYAKLFIENGQPLDRNYFYLRYIGLTEHKLLASNGIWHNVDANQFGTKNLIYLSNGSAIYQ